MDINVKLIKSTYGTNTYTKAIDTKFSELIKQSIPATGSGISVEQFFDYYEQLFFEIPVSGETNSHTYLVQTSQAYLGGSVIDEEKRALIEEINSLRQQLIDINQTMSGIDNLA